MDVVHILALADVAEERVVLYDVQGVPAHLRHLQPFVRKVGPQRADLALDKAQPGVLAVLVAFFKQQLHPKADAEQRLFFRLLFQHRHKAGGGKLCHGIPECAHPRQDKPVGGADGIGVGGDHRLQPQLLQAGTQAEQVAHAVIKNGDHTSSPFVEGISSRCAASMRTASASAWPAPLKQASRIW